MRGETPEQVIARLSRATMPQPHLAIERIAASEAPTEAERPKMKACKKCGATTRGHVCPGYPPSTGLVTTKKSTRSRKG